MNRAGPHAPDASVPGGQIEIVSETDPYPSRTAARGIEARKKTTAFVLSYREGDDMRPHLHYLGFRSSYSTATGSQSADSPGAVR